MGGAILVMLIFIGFMGGGAWYAFSLIKKTDPNNPANKKTGDDLAALNINNSSNQQENTNSLMEGQTAQDFLPYESIQHDVVNLGGHRYRAYIECGSLNYSTATEGEQNQIESSFQRFLNSLDFPLTFYVQTRTIDNSERLKEIAKECETTKKIYQDIPTLHTYCNSFEKEMENLGARIQNVKQKKKYIIIPYDDVIQFEHLNEEEKYQYAMKEIYNRCVLVSEGLRSMGILTNILSTREIYELVHSTFSKDCYSDIENIVEKEIIPTVVSATSITEQISKIPTAAKVERAIVEAQNQIYEELKNPNISEDLQKEFIEVINALNNVRENFDGNK